MNHLRASLRVPIQLPVHVQWEGQTGSAHMVSGKTENISSNGLFVTFPGKVGRNTRIQLTVEFPPEITSKPVQLLCEGRVVRWNRADEMPGFGVIIEDYEIRPAPDAASHSPSRQPKAPQRAIKKSRKSQR